MLLHCCGCPVAAHASQIMLKHTQYYDWNKTRAKYTESESLQYQSVLYHNRTSWMEYLVAHYILSNIHENPAANNIVSQLDGLHWPGWAKVVK